MAKKITIKAQLEAARDEIEYLKGELASQKAQYAKAKEFVTVAQNERQGYENAVTTLTRANDRFQRDNDRLMDVVRDQALALRELSEELRQK